MSAFTSSALRVSALALLLSSTIIAGSAMAEPGNDMSGAPNSTMTDQNGTMAATPDTNIPGGSQTIVNEPSDSSSTAMAHGMMHKGPPTAAEMQKHVDMRIKTLHDRLGITPAEESAFDNVAAAMRENEQQMSGLIADHEANRGKLSAPDSLASYAKVMQAHVDGLKRVSDAFGTLYSELSPEQKTKADKIFAEGPAGPHHKMPHKKMAQ